MKSRLKPAFIYPLILALFFAITGCALSLNQEDSELNAALGDDIQPNASLSPGDVIKIQINALQHNNADDKGIEVTYRFASPANKNVTGPLNRFKRLLKSPDYRPMLNHKTAEYDSLEISGDAATQKVTIIDPNGKANLYIFKLSKQTEGDCKDCWMTDSVIFVPTKTQNLQGA